MVYNLNQRKFITLAGSVAIVAFAAFGIWKWKKRETSHLRSKKNRELKDEKQSESPSTNGTVKTMEKDKVPSATEVVGKDTSHPSNDNGKTQGTTVQKVITVEIEGSEDTSVPATIAIPTEPVSSDTEELVTINKEVSSEQVATSGAEQTLPIDVKQSVAIHTETPGKDSGTAVQVTVATPTECVSSDTDKKVTVDKELSESIISEAPVQVTIATPTEFVSSDTEELVTVGMATSELDISKQASTTLDQSDNLCAESFIVIEKSDVTFEQDGVDATAQSADKSTEKTEAQSNDMSTEVCTKNTSSITSTEQEAQLDILSSDIIQNQSDSKSTEVCTKNISSMVNADEDCTAARTEQTDISSTETAKSQTGAVESSQIQSNGMSTEDSKTEAMLRYTEKEESVPSGSLNSSSDENNVWTPEQEKKEDTPNTADTNSFIWKAESTGNSSDEDRSWASVVVPLSSTNNSATSRPLSWDAPVFVPRRQNQTKKTARRRLTRVELIQQQRQNYTPQAKARCSHWPCCTNKNCKFWHPVKDCREEDNCPFGNKCMFIHPSDYFESNRDDNTNTH